jgi:hypothetical protein
LLTCLPLRRRFVSLLDRSLLALCLLGTASGLTSLQPLHAESETPLQDAGSPTGVRSELDAFMEKVLARREVNRKAIEEYILDETERFALLGPGRAPIHRTSRDYTWYVRDGMHVRSPVRVNGVAVGDRDRERYETDWIRREKERRARDAKRQDDQRDVSLGSDTVQVSGAVVPAEPRFVSEAYFLEFTFEPGRYYLAGREQVEGQDVLRIEYYPTQMFGERDGDGSGRERRRRQRDEDAAREIQSKMNRTSLITLWVDPAEHQIVRYTFDNVWLDFLPGGWLVRMDAIRASMTMGQPFPDVWLPRTLEVQAGATLATGSFEVTYDRAFSGYRLAEVETRIGVPRTSPRPPPRPESPDPPLPPGGLDADTNVIEQPERRPGPFVPEAAPQAEVIGEVRVHGNVHLTDAEVLAIAGVREGETLGPGTIEAIAARLSASRRFETVDVRKRYRSLTDASDVAIILVVHERRGVRSSGTDIRPGTLPGTAGSTARRLAGSLMFLPIVG